MIVRKLRLDKGWSQEQLAAISDLSVRTIQRIERGQKPSLESLKALAAAFETDVTQLITEAGMSNQSISVEEEKAILYVRDIKGFYTHLITYVAVVGSLFAFNLIRSPNKMWAVWPAIGWGIGVAIHALNVYEVFSLFGTGWEKRQVERRLKHDS
jgi:transcriptional regulator with XRE-family HTH domain